MSRLGFFLLCGAICNFMVLGQGDVPPPTIVIPVDHIPKEVPNTPSPSPPTTPPTTPSTTEPPTTEPPTTTTEPPTTTTEPPTTTPVPPKPTPKPTPAPPTPLPPPKQGTWSYAENNITCIVVQFAAQLNVTYTKTVNNSNSLANVLLNVPSNATVASGSCVANDSRQWISLSWPAGSASNNLTLVFLRNDTTKNYALQYLNMSLVPELFPNASSKTPFDLSHGSEWQTPLATSYRCAQPTQLNMTAASIVAALTLSQLQEEAFRTSSGKGFSAARECGGGDVPDAVPIAVGCALGGLVVVVLIAYLVGRRRSAARGYLSM